MFDGSAPEPRDLAGRSDDELIDAVTAWARTAAAAEARKTAAIAELYRRLCDEAGAAHPFWVCDDCDALAAQLACALNLGHGRAIEQIELAVGVHDRFPKLGARFLAGDIPAWTVTVILERTELVTDPTALAELDTALAERAAKWGPLSKYKLKQAVDTWVDRYDPDAVKRTQHSSRGRYFTVGSHTDAAGTTSVHGRMSVSDAALLEHRVATFARGVCPDDPRTLDQRRSDAAGAISAGATFLACRCDNPECAAKGDDGRASSFVIHVVADRESIDADQDPLLHGAEPREDAATPGPETPETPRPAPRPKPALIYTARGAMLPAPMLAELIAHGAAVRFVGDPTGTEDHYRPSAKLQEFIRARDLTCRFPGCDRPADTADIDHTVPWPTGVTHPANTKCYCRLHHLLKTFWTGWSDTQYPDGRVTITTPTGHTYTTHPLSGLLFADWDTTTPPPPPAGETPPPRAGRHLSMPTRRRTRSQNRAARITAERRRNAVERAAERAALARTPLPGVAIPEYRHHPDYGDDPPPF